MLAEFLKPLKVTQRELADGIGVPFQRINELVNGKRGVTPSTALRLGRFFDNSPEFWLTLQSRWDLFRVMKSEAGELQRIRPHQTAH